VVTPSTKQANSVIMESASKDNMDKELENVPDEKYDIEEEQ